jgi:hypothetical protein
MLVALPHPLAGRTGSPAEILAKTQRGSPPDCLIPFRNEFAFLFDILHRSLVKLMLISKFRHGRRSPSDGAGDFLFTYGHFVNFS